MTLDINRMHHLASFLQKKSWGACPKTPLGQLLICGARVVPLWARIARLWCTPPHHQFPRALKAQIFFGHPLFHFWLNPWQGL